MPTLDTLSSGFAAVYFALCAAVCGQSAVVERPNIVILFADDLGYGDLSSYGSPNVNTPAIDSIGRRGVRFTQFYSNSSQCTPSRVALLTGRYQQRVGGLECAIGIGNVGRYDEAVWLQQRGELGLPASETTIAAMLRDNGYDTAIIGKWHLGYEKKFWPQHHGFVESFSALGGGMDYFSHREPDGTETLVHNGEPVSVPGYITDVLVDRAIEWISRPREKPYFLYLPFTAPHSPFQGPGDGPLPADSPLWGQGNGPPAVYAAMIEHMDRRIGDLLTAIERLPSRDNTIVVFLSDNGATTSGSNRPFRGGKSSLWEGGIRVPCLMSWPRKIHAGTMTDQVALNIDLTVTLVAAAGVAAADQRRLDGVNLLDVIRGERAAYSRTVFWRYKRGDTRRKAVRDGDLKLVIDNGSDHLFDLAADPGETRNLAAVRPGEVGRLRARIATWEEEVVAPRLKDFRPSGANATGR